MSVFEHRSQSSLVQVAIKIQNADEMLAVCRDSSSERYMANETRKRFLLSASASTWDWDWAWAPWPHPHPHPLRFHELSRHCVVIS